MVTGIAQVMGGGHRARTHLSRSEERGAVQGQIDVDDALASITTLFTERELLAAGDRVVIKTDLAGSTELSPVQLDVESPLWASVDAEIDPRERGD